MPETETEAPMPRALLDEDGEVRCATCGSSNLALAETGTIYSDIRGWSTDMGMNKPEPTIFVKTQDQSTVETIRCYAADCPEMDLPENTLLEW